VSGRPRDRAALNLALSKFELRFESAKSAKDRLLLILLPNIVIHQLNYLRLLLGLYFFMDLHVAKVAE
jgi:hypothetical protein